MLPTDEKVHIRKMTVSEAIRMMGSKGKKEKIDSKRSLASNESER